MEKGLIFAVIAAACFAVCVVFIRRGAAQAGESFTAAAISVFVGIPFFAIAISVTGEWSILLNVSERALILLGAAGILHFIVGRLLAYQAYRIIGANKATPFLMTNPFYTIILGVLFLKESLTLFLIIGVLCIFAGAALITMEKKSVGVERQNKFLGTEVTGILTSLGGAVCWGISPILIKPAVEEIGSPIAGAFIAYVAASIVMIFLFFNRQRREQMAQLPLVSTVIPLIIGGIFAATGQSFVYTALSYSPASIVIPIIGTHIFFILLFSFLLNRQIEVFTLKVMLGMVAVLAGTFLLFQ